MPEIVKSRRFFQMISSIIERHKTSFKDVLCNTVLSPAKNTPNIDYNENNDQFRVIRKIFVLTSSNTMVTTEQTSRQPETRIMKGETIVKKLNE